MSVDNYNTIENPSEGLYREKGSKFLAYAHAVYSEEDIKLVLEDIRKEHPKSRHLCYAYRLGMDKNNYRANDDGEPSGSAGRPILGQIDSFGLTNVLVGVIRYFGGTKLGVPGLINAYKVSTAEALSEATIIEKTVEEVHNISFGYEHMSSVMNALKKNNINVLHQDFQDSAVIKIAIPKSEVESTIIAFKASVLGVTIEQINGDIEGIEIEYLEER